VDCIKEALQMVPMPPFIGVHLTVAKSGNQPIIRCCACIKPGAPIPPLPEQFFSALKALDLKPVTIEFAYPLEHYLTNPSAVVSDLFNFRVSGDNAWEKGAFDFLAQMAPELQVPMSFFNLFAGLKIKIALGDIRGMLENLVSKWGEQTNYKGKLPFPDPSEAGSFPDPSEAGSFPDPSEAASAPLELQNECDGVQVGVLVGASDLANSGDEYCPSNARELLDACSVLLLGSEKIAALRRNLLLPMITAQLPQMPPPVQRLVNLVLARVKGPGGLRMMMNVGYDVNITLQNLNYVSMFSEQQFP